MSKTEILTRAYRAFNNRDAENVLALMTTDVDWPNAIEGTRIVGYDQIRAYWTRQWAVSSPQVEPLAIEESGSQATVHVHQVVRDLSGSVLVDQNVDHVYSFRDDLICRMDIEAPAP